MQIKESSVISHRGTTHLKFWNYTCHLFDKQQRRKVRLFSVLVFEKNVSSFFSGEGSECEVYTTRSGGSQRSTEYRSQICLTLGRIQRGGGRGQKIFLEFFQEELVSRSAVFSSCAHIPQTHFDLSLVRISCYGYEKWRHKQYVVKPFLKKMRVFLRFLGEKCKKCQQKTVKSLTMSYSSSQVSKNSNF